MRTYLLQLTVLLAPVLIASCGTDSGGTPSGPQDATGTGASGDGVITIPDSCKGGFVTYGVNGTQFRTVLGDTVTTENLSDGLDQISPGSEEWMSVSPDGEWLLMETGRFEPECPDYACLAVAKADLSAGEAIRIDGDVLHGDDYGAIASGGGRVIYPFDGGPHEKDLYVINRQGSGWSQPILLSEQSPYAYNLQPAISADGTKVVFDCGEDPYGQPPTSICESNTDGTRFHVVWTPEQGATGVSGRADVALHHPDYFSDGSIVFEADWNGDQIWRLSGNGPPVVIADQYSNDNSPCVLANDCIVSVWLERPGGSGGHELKIMDPSGGNFSMLRTNIDLTDTGTGCGK